MDYFRTLQALDQAQLEDFCSLVSIHEADVKKKRLLLYQYCSFMLSQDIVSYLYNRHFQRYALMRSKRLVRIATRNLNIKAVSLFTREEICIQLVKELKRSQSAYKMQKFASKEECRNTLRFILNLSAYYAYVRNPIKWVKNTIYFDNITLKEITQTDDIHEQLSVFCQALEQLSINIVHVKSDYFALDEDRNLWLVAGWENFIKTDSPSDNLSRLCSYFECDKPSDVINVSDSFCSSECEILEY